MAPAKFLLELGLQGGHLRLLLASLAVEADATTNQAAGVVEPFAWQGNSSSEQSGGFWPKVVLGARK